MTYDGCLRRVLAHANAHPRIAVRSASDRVHGYRYKSIAFGKLRPGGERCVKKRIRSEVEFLAELAVLVALRDAEHVVHLYAVKVQTQCLYMEALAQDLFKFIEDGAQRLQRVDSLVLLALDIVSGLRALHRAGFIHHDLKCENILLYRDRASRAWHAKIADFGNATVRMDRATALDDDDAVLPRMRLADLFGNRLHAPPEMLTLETTLTHARPSSSERLRLYRRACHPATDVYALGILLWELFAGREYDPPVAGTPERSLVEVFRQYVVRDHGRPTLTTLCGKYTGVISLPLTHLLAQCWAGVATERATLRQVHIALKGIWADALCQDVDRGVL